MAGKIRVGIWGLGRAGNGMHIHELGLYPDMFEIVAGCDWDPARREAAAKKLPGRPVYEKGEELLKDPNVELVSVATRSPDHVKHAIQAVEAGKMVMVEKPMACRIEDALELQKVADANPGRVFVRHNRRFEAAFSHIREIIRSGKLGHIFEIKLCRHNYQWRADWQTILDCGGGQLLNWVTLSTMRCSFSNARLRSSGATWRSSLPAAMPKTMSRSCSKVKTAGWWMLKFPAALRSATRSMRSAAAAAR